MPRTGNSSFVRLFVFVCLFSVLVFGQEETVSDDAGKGGDSEVPEGDRGGASSEQNVEPGTPDSSPAQDEVEQSKEGESDAQEGDAKPAEELSPEEQEKKRLEAQRKKEEDEKLLRWRQQRDEISQYEEVKSRFCSSWPGNRCRPPTFTPGQAAAEFRRRQNLTTK